MIGGVAPSGRPPDWPREQTPARVTVVGVGHATVVPDALQLELSVEVGARGVAAALASARSTMAEVRRAILEVGVAEVDQRTSGLNIWPRHDEKSGTQSGYVATESLSILLRAPDLVDVVLAGAAEVAGDLLRVGGLRFTVTDPAAAQDEARRAALVEARRRAALYAAELERVQLGRLLRLVEGQVGHDGGDVAVQAMAHRASAEPGTQVLTIQLTAEWALQPSRRPTAPEPSPPDEPPDEPSPDER